MVTIIKKFRTSIVSKLILLVGLILLISLSTWAYLNITYQKRKAMEGIVTSADWLTRSIRLGTHHAMMHNLRDDLTRIIESIAADEKIVNIRIYDKAGQIKFSNAADEIDRVTNIEAEACYVCHRTDPPLFRLSLADRTRIFKSAAGWRQLGIISPIYNEPGCATSSCHVHPEGKKVLGALDVVLSLGESDRELATFENSLIVLGILIFTITSAILTLFVLRFVRQPIKKLMNETSLIANGDYRSDLDIGQNDELGRLSSAIGKMGKKISEKQNELNQQRDEYQRLFELVPCLISVQDRNYKLVSFNQEFAQKFNPKPGDFCYAAYKGRLMKCEICPVEKTFEDGLPHISEERGVNKDGRPSHWIVTTSPVRNKQGEIIAAMEMSLDITERKLLEEELRKSEEKYYAVFDNIPNPVFVLDRHSLEILDCNTSVKPVYGFSKEELINKSFLTLFKEEARADYIDLLKNTAELNQVVHQNKNGDLLYVNIRISPSEYAGNQVFLVTTSDITKRLQTEQQLIQASKMATLGEMATGVAHELNQPLAVIKTASRFLMRKINKKEKIKDEVLLTMAGEIDSYVDRAARIITHMRDFGRKTDVALEKFQVNQILESAMQILGQQLKVRGIAVEWDLQADVPSIKADPRRLEQVFINLLINARDAIDEKWQSPQPDTEQRKISIKTRSGHNTVIVEICDTGCGIPKQVANRIFEPFFTTKKVGHGTGLGLSISYGIIQECNGSIQAVSHPESGTCFIMKFPIIQRAEKN